MIMIIEEPVIHELISMPCIVRQTKSLAKTVADYYKDVVSQPLFLTIREGAVRFSRLLYPFICRAGLSFQVEEIGMSRYRGEEGQDVSCYMWPDLPNIEERDVIIVEDIVDKGVTALYLLMKLGERDARSIKICAMVDKPEARIIPINVDFSAFTCPPDMFVVGFGLDLDGDFRELDYIGHLHD